MQSFQLPARTENFAQLRAFARNYSNRKNVDSDLSSRLLLVLEELFTNTVKHGYLGADGMVRIELKQIPGYLSIMYEDAAPPFDPLTAVSVDPAITVSKGWVGGMGLLLIRKMADSLTYERQEPWNRTIVLLSASE